MNRGLVRTVIYPLHERLRGRPTLSFYRRFRRDEVLTPEALRDLQDRRIARLFRHAVLETAWFRDVALRVGIAADGVSTRADLLRLPLLTRAIIGGNREQLTARSRRRRVYRLETGGSSGEPLVFHTDREREASQLAARLVARGWHGLRPGAPEVDLWGSPIEIRRIDRIRRLKDRLLNFRMLSAFHLDDAAMAGFRERIAEVRPEVLYGYSSVLARYARFLESRGESLRDLRPRVAIATAEMLWPQDREVIGRVFGCPVAAEYGARDAGLMAHECAAGGLHVLSFAVHIEILDEDGAPVPEGLPGEIVVTNLWSFGMPILRYRTGDRGALSPDPCPCGRPEPILRSLEGRITDTLVLPSGRRVHGLGLIYILRELPGVRQFRCHQRTPSDIEILVVPDAGLDVSTVERRVVERATRFLDGEAVVRASLVSEIPPLPSGKHRFVISDVERRS